MDPLDILESVATVDALEVKAPFPCATTRNESGLAPTRADYVKIVNGENPRNPRTKPVGVEYSHDY